MYNGEQSKSNHLEDMHAKDGMTIGKVSKGRYTQLGSEDQEYCRLYRHKQQEQ